MPHWISTLLDPSVLRSYGMERSGYGQQQRRCEHWGIPVFWRCIDDRWSCWRGKPRVTISDGAPADSLKFVVGNTFPCVVFGSFGAFWLTYAATLQPFYGASSTYALAKGEPSAAGASDVDFLNAFGFVLLWMGFMCLIYLVSTAKCLSFPPQCRFMRTAANKNDL